MLEPFQLPFVQRGLLEVLFLSVAAGLLGTWIVLRGLAFYSHAVATAAFPGLVVADGLGFAAPLGALGAALLFALGVAQLARARQSSYDSLTAIVLVGAVALGVILASDVFHSGSNVETLLFGSLLVIDSRDVVLAAAAGATMTGANLALGQAWLARGFDPSAVRSLGLRSTVPEAALLGLIALVVVATLSAVGALLVTALLVMPAATVRLWAKDRLSWQLASIALTALEGTAGLWLSVKTNGPPGATISVLAGAAFALSAGVRTLADRRLLGPVGVAAALIAGLFLLGSCGSGSDRRSGRVEVVATTTQIADWLREVGGGRVDVHQILKANTDPHEYEPRPRDVEAVADTSLVFRNGDRLDDWIDKLVDEAGGSPTVVDLGKSVPIKLAGEASGPEAAEHDPHWWHDPRNVEEAVAEIRDALSRADPPGRRRFERSASAYLVKLRRLDATIESCFSGVPRAQRKLVTDHDAFSYFAHRYGIEVVGAVIPSQTTQAQPSAKDVSKLVDLIEKEHVRAVFPENSISPKLTRAIARQAGAYADFTLYSDTLGPPGSAGSTYLKMELSNADSMVRAFSNGRHRCQTRIG
jgi:zinc/manganese transport system substrate-binding protein